MLTAKQIVQNTKAKEEAAEKFPNNFTLLERINFFSQSTAFELDSVLIKESSTELVDD